MKSVTFLSIPLFLIVFTCTITSNAQAQVRAEFSTLPKDLNGERTFRYPATYGDGVMPKGPITGIDYSPT